MPRLPVEDGPRLLNLVLSQNTTEMSRGLDWAVGSKKSLSLAILRGAATPSSHCTYLREANVSNWWSYAAVLKVRIRMVSLSWRPARKPTKRHRFLFQLFLLLQPARYLPVTTHQIKLNSKKSSFYITTL